MKQIVLAFFVVSAIFLTSNHLCLAQTGSVNSTDRQQTLSKKQEKLKNKVLGIGVGGEITVVTKAKKKFFGLVTDVSANEFETSEVDQKKRISFKYSDLKSIYEGDGEKNLITGKRNNPQKGLIYVGALIGGLFVLLLVALSQNDS